MKRKKIVVIEKDKIHKSILELFIEQLDHELVASYLDFNDSLEFLKNNAIDTIIIDLNAFEDKINLKSYFNLIESFNFPILFIGNTSDINFAKELISLNIYSFMSKPITKEILKINISIACLKHNKLIASQQLNEAKQCNAHCTVSPEGTIVEHNQAFLDLFELDFEMVNQKHLSSIFQQNHEFIHFNKFIQKFGRLDVKKSIFQREREVYESQVRKISNTQYNMCFRQSILEEEFVFNHEKLETRFENIFSNSSESTLIFDNNNKLTRFNNNAQDLNLTIKKKELYLGLSFFDILDFIPKSELENIIETVRIPSTHILTRTIEDHNTEYTLRIRVSPLVTRDSGFIDGYIVSTTELSKENQLQKRILELEQELKPMYENTIQRFYLTDKNKKLVSFNEAAFKIIQKEYNHTLKKGDSFLNFIPNGLDKDEFNSHFQRVLKGEKISFKLKIDSSIGEYWNSVNYEPIINENGELNKVLIWTLDISESEQKLIALDQSNKRQELIAKSGNEGIWDWNIETNEVYFSPRWKSILGYSEEEIENEFEIRNSLIHPEDKKISEEYLKNFIEGKENIYTREIRLLCNNLNYKWVLERGTIIRNKNGEAASLSGSITDIAIHKETETKLLSLNSSFLEERAMFAKGTVGIIRVEANNLTEITYASESTFNITGYTPQEFYNKDVPFKHIIHPDDFELHTKERDIALKSKQTHIDFSDYRLVRKDGLIVWVKDFTSIIRDKNGYAQTLLGYIIDVSRVKEIESEYEKNQNLFSAVWQTLQTEAFIVKKSGVILLSNNQNYTLKKLLEKDYFIFDHFHSLSDWGKIEFSTSQEHLEFNTSQEYKKQNIVLKIVKIDNMRLLVTTDIKL